MNCAFSFVGRRTGNGLMFFIWEQPYHLSGELSNRLSGFIWDLNRKVAWFLILRPDKTGVASVPIGTANRMGSH
jgi:hypothetical protein